MIIHSGLVARVAGVAGVAERVDDLEPLEQLLLAVLRRLDRHGSAELVRELVDVEAAQQLAHGGRADVGEERGVASSCAPSSRSVRYSSSSSSWFGAHVLLARLDDDVVRVVDDLLEITEREVEEIAHGAGQRLEEPDVRDGNGELDVAHALATDLGQGDFDAAAVADHAAIADALVLPAMALPVLDRTEDALAEQAVLLGLERADS